MDSGNVNAENYTVSRGHLGYEETKWCEHAVIILSVLMTINMIILMCCYRMLLLGKIRRFLDGLASPSARGMVIEAPGVPDEGSRSHRPSSDSLNYPPSNPGPSTVVINNFGLYSDVTKIPGASTTTAIAGVAEKRVMMLCKHGFPMEESSGGNTGGETIKSQERERKISVFMDRPLPALPGQSGEKHEGLERDEFQSVERIMKSSTGSVVSNFQKDELALSSLRSEQKYCTTTTSKPVAEVDNSKSRLFVDIEFFI